MLSAPTRPVDHFKLHKPEPAEFREVPALQKNTLEQIFRLTCIESDIILHAR